jgi:hypothetical protein
LTRETKSAHKVGFIRETGKATPRDGQGALFVGEGSQGSQGVEWSFNISLQEYIHSPVKASWVSTLWHF